MLFKKLVVGPLWTNCYILASKAGGEAVVIDPGDDCQVILDALNQDDLRLRYIINTHGHFDHIGANGDLKEKTGAKVAMSPKENLNQDLPLGEGQVIDLEDLKINVMETPGHSEGSVSLLIDDKLFTGDLLFSGSVGRTDLPGGSVDELRKSLKKIAPLPDKTVVYPGHGSQTTLKKEKEENPFLKGL